MTRDFPAGNYRFIPAVFQYSSGAAADPGYEIERVRFDSDAVIGRGFCADRKIYSGRRSAADLVLRLRAALAGGVHRGRISELQRALRQDARGMGSVRRDHQSGGAQQCLPGDRSAGRAVILCVLFHAPEPAGGDAELSSSPAAPNCATGAAAIPSVPCATATSARTALREKVRFTVGSMEQPPWRVRLRLEGHHRGAGLYRARLSSRRCR